LHVILGMVRMECFDQLTGYVNGIAHKYQEEVGFVARQVKDPVLAGFLLGKLSRAREAGVELVLTEDCHVPMTNDAGTVHDLVTIVGNLVDNALEAVENSQIKRVTVCLDYHAGSFSLLVSDTGPGIPAERRSEIFTNGFSTKGDGRGMGLFLVQRCLNKLNGTITIQDAPGGGAHFKVIVPYLYKDGIDD